MPLGEFAQVVRNGMGPEMPASPPTGTVVPYPGRRFVWHVYPVAPRGVSRIVVNAFDGSAPFAYEQQVVENGASAVAMTGTVGAMTRQLMAKLEQRTQIARG
jgi:hypothetical protein